MSIGLPLSTALRIILLLTAFFIAGATRAQNLSEPYYVVVGGFAVFENAARFTQHLLAENYPARYAFNPTRKLYYVYVQVTADRARARQIAYQLRLESEFTGAWIYQGRLQGNAAAEANAIAEYDAETGAGSLLAEAGAGVDGRPNSHVVAGNQSTNPSATGTSAVDSAATSQSITDTTEAQPAKPAGKEFIFRLTTGTDNVEVPGPVYLLQSEKESQRITAHEKVIIPPPASGKLVVVCNVVGYKLAKRIIPYEGSGATGEVVIPIKLVPVAAGDYIELDNVKFFNNTAIFTPESESELLQLANLMKNPRCRVRLNGHTHSNESADITTLGTATNFFALDPATNIISRGSGKELSRLRAEAVKAYLVSQGIDAARISTKGYGAQLAVYEEAIANNRIEVDILKN